MGVRARVLTSANRFLLSFCSHVKARIPTTTHPFPAVIMSWCYYVSGEFLYVATTNLFNVIALLSAVLLLLDPIVFIAHSGYNFYLSVQETKAAATREKPKGRSQPPRQNLQDRIPPKTEWWKWYVVSATIHLFDAWFFRSIIPFFERARSQHDAPPNDLQDLADISRLLWGIVRTLSLFVIALEIWEQRLVLTTVLGQHYKNPKWGFAVSYFLAPAIVALGALPVAIYFILLGLWNSGGFFWGVVKEAFTPDWRSGQDVFVKKAAETIAVVKKTTSTPIPKPAWKFWE